MILVVFLNDTATTEIYTLSLHDALPIFDDAVVEAQVEPVDVVGVLVEADALAVPRLRLRARFLRRDPRLAHEPLDARLDRSEEHTSELQSRQYLVCRLLLEKKIPIIDNH